MNKITTDKNRIIPKELHITLCKNCIKYSKNDNYCKLLQLNWLPEGFGCNNGRGKK